jgi:hypothetical protein
MTAAEYVAFETRAPDERSHYYPDVMVACGPAPGDPLVETAPCALASLRTYPVVWQDRRRVEWYARDAEGEWTVADLVGDGAVAFARPAAPGGPVTMTCDDLYDGVDLPPDGA